MNFSMLQITQKIPSPIDDSRNSPSSGHLCSIIATMSAWAIRRIVVADIRNNIQFFRTSISAVKSCIFQQFGGTVVIDFDAWHHHLTSMKCALHFQIWMNMSSCRIYNKYEILTCTELHITCHLPS